MRTPSAPLPESCCSGNCECNGASEEAWGLNDYLIYAVPDDVQGAQTPGIDYSRNPLHVEIDRVGNGYIVTEFEDIDEDESIVVRQVVASQPFELLTVLGVIFGD